MASLCKRQQCTIERRGFRQDLDSWRHKLIHCVGFESILEGLFGSRLVEDLTLFKGSEPEGGTDWSFDENCPFCCVRRDKVKEHLVGLSNQGLESGAEPLLVKDQTKINRLEKQAEEFFNAVLYKKDVPSFSDPHIPGVALDIMQRMIRQFAAEYTSKSSSSTPDSRSTPRPGPHPDQSLPPPPSLPTVPPAAIPGGTATHSVPSQNPVLSKLLMADQDLPLDLTVKKPLPQPVEQDGVLDLSLKKGRAKSSTSSLRSPHLSQTPTLKGYGSPSWASKTHFGALLKLRANSRAGDHLKDLPSLLEAAGLFTKSPSCGKAIIQEAPRDPGLSLSHSPTVDLKIPQVRGLGGLGMDFCLGSLSSDPYRLLSHHCENSLGNRQTSILPKHSRLGSSGGEREYWASSDADLPASGGQYPTSDPEADLRNMHLRKKRGRYRQYNAELLEEAIGVVMQGKMSVSNAQTIYGIPHSTLEYKVKERLGTLKHPPKKKLKLMSHMEEPEDTEAPESQEALDATMDLQSVSASGENGRQLLSTRLSPDE